MKQDVKVMLWVNRVKIQNIKLYQVWYLIKISSTDYNFNNNNNNNNYYYYNIVCTQLLL